MIYLCRHGETEWSESGKHTGLTDIDLTQKGKEEAERLMRRVGKLRFDLVLSSPLKRAKETCVELMPTLEPLAVEWNYGDYEGLTSWQIQQKNPDWNLFVDGAPNGESPEQVEKRADELLEKIRGKEVILFSHGHFLRVLAARFLGLGVEYGQNFHLDTGALSILGYEKDSPAIFLWNERDNPSTQ